MEPQSVIIATTGCGGGGGHPETNVIVKLDEIQPVIYGNDDESASTSADIEKNVKINECNTNGVVGGPAHESIIPAVVTNQSINQSNNNNNNHEILGKSKAGLASSTVNSTVSRKNSYVMCHTLESKNQLSLDETGGVLSPDGGSSVSPLMLSPCRSTGSDNGTVCTEEDVDEISRLFESRPGAFEKWLKERASSDTMARIHAITETKRFVIKGSPKRASVTSDLFQQWLQNSPIKRNRSPTSRGSIGSRKHLQSLDEGELFMELIRDVANELDIDILCHKILVNVGLLTHADRGSLFLAKGPPNARFLVAKLFDVTQDTAFDDAVHRAKAEEIIIPFGVGIAGSVAQTKETINIKEAYKDPRFNCEIDMKTGYKTHVILSMPICNYEGDVIGVAQIINKTNGSNEFSERDVEVFRRYLTFCGIGVQNAQLFEMSVQEYRRNQILLNLARSIFEEQNNLECLVTKIMTEARELLKCERCAVYLLDLDCCESSHLERIVERPTQVRQPLSRRQSHNVNVEDIILQQKSSDRFTMLFELEANNQSANVSRPSVEDTNNSTLAQIAQYVSSTGITFNISDVEEWLKDKPEIKRGDETNAKTILCMPIFNGQKRIIGVALLINKLMVEFSKRPSSQANYHALLSSVHKPHLNSFAGSEINQFTDSDISIFEAFAIFCGLGIHNTQMYENACKLMAKQKVALECLSYHATAPPDLTIKLMQDTIPSAEIYSLYSFNFSDFDLNDDDTCRAAIRMFLQCNLVQQFHIPYDVLCRWTLSVKKNYRPVKYHNWRHALNVAQTMFAMMKTGKMERFLTDLEILGLLVACLCHDLDHRGTNNAFQTKTDSPLAILYSTSTMEHHHFDQCIMILNSEGNNIFQALSPDDYRRVMKIVETAILSTDLAMYFKKRNSFLELIDNGEFDWQSEEKKELLCGMMMTACDVSAIAKPWEVQHKVAKMVADEFFDQGDLEKLQLNTQPIAMMDRDVRGEDTDTIGAYSCSLRSASSKTSLEVCLSQLELESSLNPELSVFRFNHRINCNPYSTASDFKCERKDELPKMQVGFIDVICLPLYRVLSETFPWIRPLYEGTVENRQNWQDLAEKVEMGLTWIDHDTIDKPVEEFSAACSDEIKDIEFTVTTLNCSHSVDDNSSSAIERRQRFSSLKKPGAIGKAVRAKLTKSFHSSDNSHHQIQQSKEKQVHKEQSSSSSTTGGSTGGTSGYGGGGGAGIQTTNDQTTTKKLNESNSNESMTVIDNRSDTKNNTKRRSKLCHLL